MTRALCLALTLLLAAPAGASAHRGFLTPTGLAGLGAGLGFLAAGLGLTLRAGSADAALSAYYAPGNAPRAEEVTYVAQLQARSASDHRFGAVFLGVGGALAALGLTAVVLDGVLGGSATVALAPGAAGPVLTLRWER